MSDFNRIVVAGAGTGKTYTLVQAYLKALKKYKPSEILALTFTQKAAAEMRSRVTDQIQTTDLLSAPICTFHALCAQIVGDDFGEFELLAPADDEKLSLKIAKEAILEALEAREFEVGPLVARFQISSLAESLVKLLQDVREAGLEPEEVKVYARSKNLTPNPSPQGGEGNLIALSAAFRDLRASVTGLKRQWIDPVVSLGSFLCEVFTAPDARVVKDLLISYAQKSDVYKQEHRCFGFCDLLVLAKKILVTQKNRFKCVLIDEYQDTSPIQEQLVQLLSREIELFIVGDPKQSIYGFRGADASVFERVLGQRESLTLSRRSQGAIIDLVNLVARANMPGFDNTQALSAMHEHQGQAGAIWKADWALQVKNLIDSGRFKPQEIIILVRRIKSAAPMVSELLALGVPARVYGGEGFYERQEIYDIAAALFILIAPQDPLARLTLLRSPMLNLPDSALLDWQQDLPALFDDLRGCLGKLSVAELIDRLLLETHYVQAIAKESDADQCFANILKLRLQFIDVIDNYEVKIRDLWETLEHPPKESLAEPFDSQEDSVVIMTMHQSKGLEFPVVILADLASTQPSDSEPIAFDPELGLAVTHKNRALALCAPKSPEEKKKFPTPIDAVRQKARAQAEAELPRLLYVALTRAKQAVYVIDLEASDRGPSLMRLLKQARTLDPELFDKLMPALNIEKSVR